MFGITEEYHCTIFLPFDDEMAFTHRSFYIQKLLQTEAFTHKSFYIQTLLLTDAFYTQTLLHTDAFTHRRFYTQTLLHTDAFAHRRFYTQTLLHTDAFTPRRFYTQTLLHTNAFTHRGKRLHSIFTSVKFFAENRNFLRNVIDELSTAQRKFFFRNKIRVLFFQIHAT